MWVECWNREREVKKKERYSAARRREVEDEREEERRLVVVLSVAARLAAFARRCLSSRCGCRYRLVHAS